jgi:transposase
MNEGKSIFSQLIGFLPDREFRRCVARYNGDRYAKKLSCWQQFLAMAFAQLTYRESLRDIEACLGAVGPKLYHMGFGSAVARSTLADANENRDWRIFADFAQVLIRTAIKLHAKDSTGIAEVRDLYALDSTTIDLCLALFPWAKFRKHKAAVKMHTLLDLRGSIPTFIHITDGKVHDVNILDEVAIEAGAFYVMDRGYIDFERLYRFTLSSAFFVVRTKANILLQRRYSHLVDRSTGLRSDHTAILTAMASVQAYPDPLRRVTYCDPETGKRLKFLTNNFTLPPLVITEIYKKRWAVELFFRWIKMHLRIKAFYGTSPNAVKTQIWIAVSIYVLVAIVRKRLGIEASLYQLLQIFSVTLFEKTPILRALQRNDFINELHGSANQLILFDF